MFQTSWKRFNIANPKVYFDIYQMHSYLWLDVLPMLVGYFIAEMANVSFDFRKNGTSFLI